MTFYGDYVKQQAGVPVESIHRQQNFGSPVPRSGAKRPLANGRALDDGRTDGALIA
jgi:hypothetical protein